MNETFLLQLNEFITFHPKDDLQEELLNEFPYLQQDKLNADLFCLKLFLLDYVLIERLDELEKRNEIFDSVLFHSLQIDGLDETEKAKVKRQISKKIEFFAKYSSTQLHESLTNAPQNIGIAYGIANGKKEEDYIKIGSYFSKQFILYYHFFDTVVTYHFNQK